jgi:hypothetical protein
MHRPRFSSPANIPVSATNGAAEITLPSGAITADTFDGEGRSDASGGEDGERNDNGCLFHGSLSLWFGQGFSWPKSWWGFPHGTKRPPRPNLERGGLVLPRARLDGASGGRACLMRCLSQISCSRSDGGSAFLGESRARLHSEPFPSPTA